MRICSGILIAAPLTSFTFTIIGAPVTFKLLAKTKIPQVREFITRRMTAGMPKAAAN